MSVRLSSLLFLGSLAGCYSAFGADDATDRPDGRPFPTDFGPPRDARLMDTSPPPFDFGPARDLGDLGPRPDAFDPDSGLGAADATTPGFDAAPMDGGPPTDMGPPPPPTDLGPRPDLGSSDAEVGLDAGPPPPPTGCAHSSPPRLDVSRIREEAYWTASTTPNANTTPIVADLDPGDGDPGRSVIWTRSTFGESQGTLSIARIGDSLPFQLGTVAVDATATPAVADLDGDGALEIITLREDAGLVALNPNGTLLWTSSRPSLDDLAGPGGDKLRGAAITVADLEGDGSVEVIVGKWIFDGSTGAPRPSGAGDRGAHAGAGPIACVGDVNGDGVQEVVAGGTAYGPEGGVVWNAPSVPDGFCALGEVRGDVPGLEVVVAAEGTLYVLDGADGTVLDQTALLGTSPEGIGGGPPALADVDGDGFAEIAVAHGDRLAIYDFTCGDGRCMGAVRWAVDMVDRSPTAGVSFGDLNGDGRFELFALDRFTLYVFDARVGTLLLTRATASVSITQAPIMADVDLDGDAELLIPSSRLAATGMYVEVPRPGIQVLGQRDGRWIGARSIWNQHAYHSGNVTDSGAMASTPPEAFRWQSNGDDPFDLPNLWGSATVECLEGGRALIRVTVTNAGLAPAGDFDVELTRGVRDIPVTIVPVAGPLNPGERAQVPITTDWRPPMQVYVDRRRNGNVLECNERDNRIDLPDLACP